jgi:hypothetical protein
MRARFQGGVLRAYQGVLLAYRFPIRTQHTPCLLTQARVRVSSDPGGVTSRSVV